MITIDSSGASAALQVLTAANAALNQTLQQVSTGKSVATAEDDPADYVIASRMQSDIGALTAVNSTLASAQVPTRVANAAISSVSDALNKIQQTVIEAQSGGPALAQANTQIQSLLDQISGNVADATVGGTNLIAGAVAGDVTSTAMTVPSGLNGQTQTIGGSGVSVMNASVPGLGLSGFNAESGGISIQFPSIYVPASFPSSATDDLGMYFILSTPNDEDAASEVPGNPGQSWMFQLGSAEAMGTQPVRTATSVDANGNVLQQNNYIPVDIEPGFTTGDIANALQRALSDQWFVGQVTMNPIPGSSTNVSLSLNLAGNNIDADSLSSSYNAACLIGEDGEPMGGPSPTITPWTGIAATLATVQSAMQKANTMAANLGDAVNTLNQAQASPHFSPNQVH